MRRPVCLYELSIGSRGLAEEAFWENEVLESARVSVELWKLHRRTSFNYQYSSATQLTSKAS